MNRRHLPLLAAVAMVPLLSPHAQAAWSYASSYVHTSILPPGAQLIGADTFVGGNDNPINGKGVVALHALLDQGGNCGILRPFVYFPAMKRYVVLKSLPQAGRADATAFGIADDNSLGIAVTTCSDEKTSFYRVKDVGKTPRWSRPRRSRGYDPMGNNSDGVGLNSLKHGRPAVLTFPGGAPKVTPLKVRIGKPSKAQMTAVGTPAGFIGTQRNPTNHKDVPTVWLHARPYRLPVGASKFGLPTPLAMDEHHTAHGLRVDVVGTFYGHNYDALAADYWLGKPSAHGFAFVEKRLFIRSHDLRDAFGISTDGSMIFGDCCGDITEADLIIYFTASHKENHNFVGCPDSAPASGDSHGDILIESDPLCLAQPRH